MKNPNNLGIGVGLRRPHIPLFLSKTPPTSVEWVEVISENYMAWEGRSLGPQLAILQTIRRQFPVALHGVSMSLGSAEPLSLNYLKRLKELVDLIDPIFVSDHLSWSRYEYQQSHDLLPIPYTQEALSIFCNKVDFAQNYLKRPLLIENPSSYFAYSHSEMSETDFINLLVKKTDCFLLLDINNVFVSAHNHNFNAKSYLKQLPHAKVQQIHLAGHSASAELLIDTHGTEICEDVWALYSWYLKNFGPRAVMIERDDCIPPWNEFEREIHLLKSITPKMRLTEDEDHNEFRPETNTTF